MTIYEQIQRSVEYIEQSLCEKITAENAAAQAFMSIRSYYTYFQLITGYTYKEYVIKRRLASAAKIISKSKSQIIDIAFAVGYGSHESFTRAFKREFQMTPIALRHTKKNLKLLEKPELIKEMYMGVIIKKLTEMKAVTFSAFQPSPEDKANTAMEEWKKQYNPENNPQRIFGHNIDKQGNSASDPENVGYKILLTTENIEYSSQNSVKEIIPSGTFVITGIEGNFTDDPNGSWISEGWKRMDEMVKKKGYSVKSPGCWYEERIEPSKPGNLRLDLYMEIEA